MDHCMMEAATAVVVSGSSFWFLRTTASAARQRDLQLRRRRLPGLTSPVLLPLLILCLLLLPGICSGLRITDVKVPQYAFTGDTVKLQCNYDEDEGDTLYSVNWWKDNDQFYTFVPGQKVSLYDVKGIIVDKSRSTLNTVVLRNLSIETGGEFKCEVLADYPTFEKDSQTHDMDVYDQPDSNPILRVEREQYLIGDMLLATCTTLGARPAPTIDWLVNGIELDDRHSNVFQTEGPSLSGLLSPTSELRLDLHNYHFQNGHMKLTCVASISGVYHIHSEQDIFLPGYKNVAPSQKLYGAGSTIRCIGGTELLIAALLTAWFI